MNELALRALLIVLPYRSGSYSHDRNRSRNRKQL